MDGQEGRRGGRMDGWAGDAEGRGRKEKETKQTINFTTVLAQISEVKVNLFSGTVFDFFDMLMG